MTFILSILTLLVISCKYRQRFSATSTCPYCKGKECKEDSNNITHTPFQYFYTYFQVKTYTCNSCLNYFHVYKNKTKLYLNYTRK